MSLLADLLSKIKQPQTKREVPPNLKNIVQSSARQSAKAKKILLLSALFIGSVTAGLLGVYFVKSIAGPSKSGPGIAIPNMTAHVDNPEKNGKHKSAEIRESTPEKSEMMERNTLHAPQSEAEENPEHQQSDDNRSAAATLHAADGLSEAETGKEEQGSAVNHSDAVSVSDRADSSPTEMAGLLNSGNEITEPVREDSSEERKSSALQGNTMNKAAIDRYLYSARTHEKKGDYSGALADYKKVLEIDQNSLSVLNSVAYIYLQVGLIDESIQYSGKALGIKKDSMPAFINLGIAYARLGNTNAAEDYLNRALQWEPDNESGMLNLAILYERQEDYSGASEYYSRLMRIGNIEGILGLARIYEKQGSIENAVRLYKNISSLDSVDDTMKLQARQRIIQLLRN
jgi:tetratricopeptide (TPR) repeat protein